MRAIITQAESLPSQAGRTGHSVGPGLMEALSRRLGQLWAWVHGGPSRGLSICLAVLFAGIPELYSRSC